MIHRKDGGSADPGMPGTPIRFSGPPHQKGLGCIKWAEAQPRDPMFVLGDVVRDIESGNIGVIVDFNPANDRSGWPSEYALREIAGCGRLSRCAWFYDLDLEMVKPSAVREFVKDPPEEKE